MPSSLVRCPHCGHEFYIEIDSSQTGELEVECPSCHQKSDVVNEAIPYLIPSAVTVTEKPAAVKPQPKSKTNTKPEKSPLKAIAIGLLGAVSIASFYGHYFTTDSLAIGLYVLSLLGLIGLFVIANRRYLMVALALAVAAHIYVIRGEVFNLRTEMVIKSPQVGDVIMFADRVTDEDSKFPIFFYRIEDISADGLILSKSQYKFSYGNSRHIAQQDHAFSEKTVTKDHAFFQTDFPYNGVMAAFRGGEKCEADVCWDPNLNLEAGDFAKNITSFWGALALGDDGDTWSWGYTYNQKTQEAAEQTALAQCQLTSKNCELAHSFIDSCVSLVSDVSGTWWWSERADAETALNFSLESCDGTGCQNNLTFCGAELPEDGSTVKPVAGNGKPIFYWAALAVGNHSNSEDWAWGYSYNHTNKATAELSALKACQAATSDCQVEWSSNNVCISLFVDETERYFWTSHETREIATEETRDHCGGKDCKELMTYCHYEPSDNKDKPVPSSGNRIKTSPWGALAVGQGEENWAWGQSSNYDSPQSAEAAALEKCNAAFDGKCAIEKTIQNSCVGLSADPTGPLHTFVDSTEEKVKQHVGLAIDNCKGLYCREVTTVCSYTPSEIARLEPYATPTPVATGKSENYAWGAVAFGERSGDKVSAHMTEFSVKSRKQAEDFALEQCNEDSYSCEAHTFRENCAAIYVSEYEGYFWGTGDTESEAIDEARQDCQGYDDYCSKTTSFCLNHMLFDLGE